MKGCMKTVISNHKKTTCPYPDVQPLLICARGAGILGLGDVLIPQGYPKRTFAPTPTSSPDIARGSRPESPIMGLVPSMAATAKPPAMRPSADIASSRFPRAAPWMKPEIPKVLLLSERSACAGRARPTPPRKDWTGVGPGTGMGGDEKGHLEKVRKREGRYTANDSAPNSIRVNPVSWIAVPLLFRLLCRPIW